MITDLPSLVQVARWASLLQEEPPAPVTDAKEALETLKVAIAMLMSDGILPAKKFTLHAWEALRFLAEREESRH